MEKLTLRNFSDLLDPEILDEGLAFFTNEGFHNLLTVDGVWAAEYEEDGHAGEIAVEITNGTVVSAQCTCDHFEEDNWVDGACVHLAAMLFAIKSGQATESPAGRRGRPKAAAESTPKAPKEKKEKVPKTPAKPKDPAEAVLGELEPKEIYEFVRQMIGKNKDFKSQFLMHFSDKTAGSAQQFDEIIIHAIAAVKGRRKYLKGADGAKIATSLTPLYKQAANTEAKGFLRESFAICKSLLHHLPKVFAAMETASAKLNTLLENTMSVISLIINNSTAPFELRNEVFEVLLAEYIQLETDAAGSLKDEVYERVIASARAIKRLEDVEKTLQQLLAPYAEKGAKPAWSIDFFRETALIERLLNLYEKEIKDDLKVNALLERNKHIANFYLRLIDKKIADADFPMAIQYTQDMTKNVKKYGNQISIWDLDKSLNNRLLEIYRQSKDHVNLSLLAGKLFKASNFQDITYFKLEKSACPPEKWAGRVDSYLQQMKSLRGYAIIGSYYEVLLLEERWQPLMDKVAETTNLSLWKKYGQYLKHRFPSTYLKGLQRALETELKQSYSGDYTVAVTLLEDMKTVEGGSELAKKLVVKFKEQYANRRTLLSLLNKIIVA